MCTPTHPHTHPHTHTPTHPQAEPHPHHHHHHHLPPLTRALGSFPLVQGPPSSPAPTPWFEHPGHRTNLSELQSRMVAAETQARDTAAVVEQMRVDLSRTRAALLRAVNTEPAMPRQCSGGGCSPAIAAIGDSVSISAPIGTVGVTTQTCEVDDLCGAGSFAENLKEALRSI